ncbi:MAG: hypothetical protein QM497_01445 [Sulfurimonas sp.]
MKTIKILIISLLLVVTQAFAWGKSEQKALLGFTAGVVLTHLVSNYDNNSYKSYSTKTVYVQEPRETVYIDRYQRHEEFRHNKKRYHHNRDRFSRHHYDRRYNRGYNKKYTKHHRKHNRVVVQNHYITNYYY